MGSSNRKKKEKKKDFQVRVCQIEKLPACTHDFMQKPKYKVGKTQAKASNFTDTSFKSKGMKMSNKFQRVSALLTNRQRL